MGLDRGLLSVVVPVLDEEEVLPALWERLAVALDAMGFDDWEVIFVSDGSTDRTEPLLLELARGQPRVGAVFLARNFGHQAAVSVGLAHARGSVVAIVDGDLQDPPEALPALVEALEAGADVAYGVRRRRKERAPLRAAYWLFYRLLAGASSTEIPLDTGDFCAMRRAVVDALVRLPERRRFVRGLRAWVGFRQVPVEYERAGRHAGAPKYTVRRLVRLAYDGLFSFSSLPVRLMQAAGFATAALAAVVGLVYLVLALVVETPRGFPTLMLSIWFLGGVQVLCLGVIGEYVFRTFDETRGRPVAVVRERVGRARPDAGEPHP
jgi:dolichol-phosphate mannosyltransferase